MYSYHGRSDSSLTDAYYVDYVDYDLRRRVVSVSTERKKVIGHFPARDVAVRGPRDQELRPVASRGEAAQGPHATVCPAFPDREPSHLLPVLGVARDHRAVLAGDGDERPFFRDVRAGTNTRRYETRAAIADVTRVLRGVYRLKRGGPAGVGHLNNRDPSRGAARDEPPRAAV